MTQSTDRDAYEMVVGLEVHVQLKTRTQGRSAAARRDFGAPPNRNTCPVCLALPGRCRCSTRRRSSSRRAPRSRSAARCTTTSIFARKNYFYPDLPRAIRSRSSTSRWRRGGRLRSARRATARR